MNEEFGDAIARAAEDPAVVDVVQRTTEFLQGLIDEGLDGSAVAGMIIGMGIGMYADGGIPKRTVHGLVAKILDGVFARGQA